MPRHRTLSRLAVLGIAIAIAFGAGCSKSPTGPNDTTWLYLRGNVQRLSTPAFLNGRTCWVYLPPGYAHTDQRYPVLYVQDGELAFDGSGAMNINRTCEALIRRGEIAPIIVVAIENGDGTRGFDYTPWPIGFYPPGREGGGDAYVRAIRDGLKPEIDRRFRTLPDPSNTAITGMSLGGLISVYAVYTYTGTFGKVAAFSPSYWWSNFHQYVDSCGRPANLSRIYQDTGYPDDNWIGGIERIMLDQGFDRDLELMSYEAPGAEHDYPAWEHRMPVMLRFLFPPPPPG